MELLVRRRGGRTKNQLSATPPSTAGLRGGEAARGFIGSSTPSPAPHAAKALTKPMFASVAASACLRWKQFVQMGHNLYTRMIERVSQPNAPKKNFLYFLALYVLINQIWFSGFIGFVLKLLSCIQTYFLDEPRDMCFRLSHFIMTTVMSRWNAEVSWY